MRRGKDETGAGGAASGKTRFAHIGRAYQPFRHRYA